MYCTNCGLEIADSSSVCPYCGVTIDPNCKQVVPEDGGKRKRAKKINIFCAVFSVMSIIVASAIIILINIV